MQQSTSLPSLIQHLTTPMFLVHNNIVTAVNNAAKNLYIQEGMKIETLIQSSYDEYQRFRKGKLFLTLEIFGTKYNAAVTIDGETHIFATDTNSAAPATSLNIEFAKSLREPLYTAVTHVDLMYNDAITDNEQDTRSLLITRQKLFQMLRSIQNITDTDPRQSTATFRQFEYRDIVSFLNGCLSRLKEKASFADLLEIKTLDKKIVCYFDPNSLERALLNLIANAIKHGSGKKIAVVDLQHKEDRLYITVKNQFVAKNEDILDPKTSSVLASDPFASPYDAGIGCGIRVVRNTALEHGGTLHMHITKHSDNTVCEATFTMTISTAGVAPQMLYCPTNLIIDRSSGYDRILIDMSDLLTPDDYR